MGCLLLGAPGAGAGKTQALTGDPVDAPASGLDLVGASLVQTRGDIVVTLETAAPLTAAAVADGVDRRACVVLRSRRTTQVCVAPGDGGLRLRMRRKRGTSVVDHRIRGRVTLAGTVLTLRFAARSAGLSNGALTWRVRSTWGAADTCQTGCADRLPDTGGVPARLRLTPRGCVARRGLGDIRDGPSRREVALTFDDGPGVTTPQILGALERAHVVATFFLVGKEVAGRGGLLRRMLADGDAIGNHSFNHANLAGGAGSQIGATNAAIRRATGYTPCVFRAPYGAVSRTLDGQVAAARMNSVLWDDDPRDWSSPGTPAIVRTVLGTVHPGSIVIMHDGGGVRTQTLHALPAIIRSLRRKHLRPVTVPQLLGLPTRY